MKWCEFRVICAADLSRYKGSRGLVSGLKVFLRFRGFRIVFLTRWVAFLRYHAVLKYISPPFVLFHYWAQTLYSTQLSYSSKIGSGFYIPHTGGIVINPRAVIGSNCYLAHNVTIGKVHAGEKVGVPNIGDDVFLGVGAVILGNIRIGRNVAIAANSVVTDDIPDNCFAAGAPAKVVSPKGAKEILGYAESSSA